LITTPRLARIPRIPAVLPHMTSLSPRLAYSDCPLVLVPRLPPSCFGPLLQRPARSSMPHSYPIYLSLESLLLLPPSRLSIPRSRPSCFFEHPIFAHTSLTLYEAYTCIVSRCSHYLDLFACPVIPPAVTAHLDVALI